MSICIINLCPVFHKVNDLVIENTNYSKIEIKDNIAYVADHSYGLRIYDVSDAAEPVLINSLPLSYDVHCILLDQPTAYLLCYSSNAMYILDTQDITSPVVLSQYYTTYPCLDVSVNANYAFISIHHELNMPPWEEDFIEIVNIEHPQNPFYVDDFIIASYCPTVKITDDIAFIGTLLGLYVYDISDINNIVQIDWLDTHNTFSLKFHNDLLFCDGWHGLTIIDYSDPTNCQILAEYDEFDFQNCEIIGNRIYTSSSTRLRVLDITDPLNVYQIGYYLSTNMHNSVAVSQNYAFINDYYNTLHIIDVSDPETPEYLNSLNVSDINEIYKSTEDELLILRTNNYETLEFYSMNDPANPEFLYSYNEDGWYCDTFFIDEYIACATFRWRFYIFDLTDPEELIIQGPTSLNYPSPTSWVRCIARKDNYLYLATDSGILIVDVSDMGNPNPILDIDINGYIFDLTIKDNFMYYVNIGGLQIYDITNPLDPIECGFWDSNNRAESFTIYNGFVYLADYDGGLKVIDISDPCDPVLVNTIILNYNSQLTNRPIVRDNKLMVIDNRWNEIFVFDLSNPSQPQYTSSFRWFKYSNDIEMFDNYLYSSQDSNISILDFTEYLSDSNEFEMTVPPFNLINYPNPFNPSTTIEFSIQNDSNIELSIYNIKGQKINTLAHSVFNKGNYSIIWKGDDKFNKPVSSGVYFYKLNVNDEIEAVKKCLLLK